MKEKKQNQQEILTTFIKRMLEILNDNNKRDVVLNTLQVTIEREPINIIHEDFTETEKNKIRSLILRGVKTKNARLILKFHNCLNCKKWIKQMNDEYKFNKPCKILTRSIINNLYYDGIKCKFFEEKVGDFEK